MPNIRILPKWLAFLVPLSLSLAVLGTVGCGGDNDHTEPPKPPPPPPPPSAVTELASLSINHGTFAPAFNANQKHYTTESLVYNPGNFAITATLRDAKARLEINDVQRTSGVAVPFLLGAGENKFHIRVTAEDGRYVDSTYLTVSRNELNTKLWVFENWGGAPVENVSLRVTESALDPTKPGKLVADNLSFPVNRNGSLILGLDKTKKYNIYAKAPNTAEACFQMFDPSRESEAMLFCHRRSTGAALPATAPIFTDFKFSFGTTAFAEFRPMPPGENYLETLYSNMSYLWADVIAESAIDMGGQTSVDIPGQAFLAVNTVANQASFRTLGGWALSIGTPVIVNDKEYYKSGPYWQLNTGTHGLNAGLANPNHYISMVVYDKALNRTETRLYVKVTNSVSTAGDPDISGRVGGAWYALQGQTVGLKMDNRLIRDEVLPVDVEGSVLPAPGDTRGVDYGIYLDWNLLAADGWPTTSRTVRGFEIERSTHPTQNFKVIYKRYFATTSTLSTYSYTDRDPELLAGVPYYYRVRMFNGNPANGGYSQYTRTTEQVQLLPSFNVHLTSPAHYSTSNKVWPTFKFKPSNLELFTPETTEAFLFTLYVREKADGYPITMQYFVARYYDSDGNPVIGNPIIETRATNNYGDPTGPWIPVEDYMVWQEADGTFVIDPLEVLLELGSGGAMWREMQPGLTYEWNIFGYNGTASNIYTNSQSVQYSPTFESIDWPTVATSNMAYHWSYSRGGWPGVNQGAANGFLTVTIDPAAQ